MRPLPSALLASRISNRCIYLAAIAFVGEQSTKAQVKGLGYPTE